MTDKIKMRQTFPTDFRVRLSNVGTDTFSGSYKMMKDTNALKLLFRSVNIISQDFAGKENSLGLKYSLACLILSGLNYPKESFEKNVSEIRKQIENGAWELKKEKEVKP